MQIDIFTVCDNSQQYGTKIIIMGPFNRITASSFPCVHDSFSIIGRIGYEKKENGQKKYFLTFKDPDGKDVFQHSWDVDIDIKDDSVNYVQFKFKVDKIQFNKPGTYDLSFSSEGITRVLKIYLTQDIK